MSCFCFHYCWEEYPRNVIVMTIYFFYFVMVYCWNLIAMLYFQSTIQDLFNIDIAENDASRRMAEVLDRDNEKERRRQKDDAQVYFSFLYICVIHHQLVLCICSMQYECLQEHPFQVEACYISAFCVCMYRRLYLADSFWVMSPPHIILSISWLPVFYNGCCNTRIFIYSFLDTVLWARA